jgi:hypothetical protein
MPRLAENRAAACVLVSLDEGEHVEFFDRDGLMVIDAHVESD